MHLKLLFAAWFTTLCLRADFSYEQSSRITGGVLMRYASMMGEKGNLPTLTTVAVKGNKMVYRVGKGDKLNSAQIIDIDKETITRVNFDEQSWSVLTFAQMRGTLDRMQQKTGPPDAGVAVAFKEAKQVQKLGGYDAKEVVMTVALQGKDARTGSAANMTITDQVWLTSAMSGSEQIRAFHKRMGEKLDWAPGGNPAMMGTPDIARAMAEMFKQGTKFEGLPVHQVLTLNGKLGTTPSAQAGTDQSLMEMTTDITKYSAELADAKWFEVPEGFKKMKDPAVKADGR